MLEGSLVRLRPIASDDGERRRQWLNDPEVTRYYSRGYPVSRAESNAWVERASKETSPPQITLAIETVAGRHIGITNLDHIDRDNRSCELGIMIGEKDCWSQGYGTDTVLTLLRFAFDEVNLNRVWLDVNAENKRAVACYLKCGFVEEAQLRQHRYKAGVYSDSLIMAALADEFRAKQADDEAAEVGTPG